ncbi:MAG: tRNA (N(6)-L-threonylcarbamoyladenosine(37)-C(2))-methylthiotransferase MtaB [Ruminococcaceae bacterium]|nr:tRNA (N(6)-L-threonylcarbamoyladenosine(37)-C(2))-methylthiotransferase MtaB [Oscillospiraceae bacterium]
MSKLSVHTLGCKVNQYETEAIIEQFLNGGYTLSDNESADVIIINSCTVTAESDRKTRQILRRSRRENQNSVIVLTGCMVQAFSEKSAELIDADLLIGNTETHLIYEKVERYLKTKENLNDVLPHTSDEEFCPLTINNFSDRTRAFMKIEDGCDRYCTYCIIPFARGRIRSRSLKSIKEEALNLASSGFKEIVLVGINLSSYGKFDDFDLCDAVETVASVEGIKRIRLGSLEPDLITDAMLNRLAAEEKFCPQFHLSLQSGCSSTLKRMNRHYDAVFYYDLVLRIRKAFKNPSITTDIMVGFAGETEEEFKESLAFVEKVGFAKSHIFSYSRREGTVAAALKNQVSKKEKLARSKQMIALTEKTEKEFLRSQLHTVSQVLFETEENGYFVGYTPNYTKVFLKSNKNISGEILPVNLKEIKNDGCLGIMV